MKDPKRNGKSVSTKAFSIETLDHTARELDELIKQAAGMSTAYAPYRMRRVNPEGFLHAIRHQNKLLSNQYIVVLENAGPDIFHYVENYIRAVPGVKDVISSRTINTTRKYNTIVDKKNISSIRSNLKHQFDTWYNDPLIVPEDAKLMAHQYEGAPRIVIPHDGYSSGEESYMTTTSASFISAVTMDEVSFASTLRSIDQNDYEVIDVAYDPNCTIRRNESKHADYTRRSSYASAIAKPTPNITRLRTEKRKFDNHNKYNDTYDDSLTEITDSTLPLSSLIARRMPSTDQECMKPEYDRHSVNSKQKSSNEDFQLTKSVESGLAVRYKNNTEFESASGVTFSDDQSSRQISVQGQEIIHLKSKLGRMELMLSLMAAQLEIQFTPEDDYQRENHTQGPPQEYRAKNMSSSLQQAALLKHNFPLYSDSFEEQPRSPQLKDPPPPPPINASQPASPIEVFYASPPQETQHNGDESHCLTTWDLYEESVSPHDRDNLDHLNVTP